MNVAAVAATDCDEKPDDTKRTLQMVTVTVVSRMMRMMLPLVQQLETEDRQKPKPAERRAAEALGDGSERAAPRLEKNEVEINAQFTASQDEVLRNIDFEQMSLSESDIAKRAIQRLRLPVDTLITRRFVSATSGRKPDARAVLRRAVKKAGEVDRLAMKMPRRRPPNLVALCDISGSMSRYSRMILHFMHAITNDRDRVNTFLFGTRLTNVTRYLRYKDVDDALDRVTGAVDDWSGGTRIGNSLREFNLKWSRRSLSQGAVVLLITDGLDRDAAEGLEDEVVRLHKSCRRLIWLNPLLRYDRYEPKSLGARALLPNVDDFRSVHNLESLDQLTRALSNESIDRSNIQRLLEATE